MNPTTPILLDAATVAELLSVAESTIWRMCSAGQLPEPVRIGTRCTRWRRAELESWCAAGCPSRARWETIREGGGK